MISEKSSCSVLENPHLTASEKLVYFALREYTDEDGTLLITVKELSSLMETSYRTVQGAISKMTSHKVILIHRTPQGHIENIEFLQVASRWQTGRKTGSKQVEKQVANSQQIGRSQLLPEPPDMNKSSTALETKDVLLNKPNSSLEPETTPSEPAPKTGYNRIQEIWETLTRDPYELSWCMALSNRYGPVKVVDAFETAYLKGIHQDTLHCPLKAYLTKICQNKATESVNPKPAPGSMFDPNRKPDFARIAKLHEEGKSLWSVSK